MDIATITLLIAEFGPYIAGGLFFVAGSFVGFKKVKKLIKDKRTKLVFDICDMTYKELQMQNKKYKKFDENDIIKHVSKLKNIKLTDKENEIIKEYLQKINK